MKTTCIIFVLLLSINLSFGQSLSVFDVDASNFPTIKAKFFAFDKDGNQISNLNPSDFEVKENGQPRTVAFISCPSPKPPQALSSVLVFDVSGSMSDGPPRIQSAKDAANAWIDGLPLGKSECALISFNEYGNIVQDFITSRDKLKVAIDKLTPGGGTNYNQALIDYPAGGLQIAKSGKYKRVIIFLTDGLPNFEPKTSEIIKFANDNQITIYAVTLDMPAPQSIKDITMQTGGQYFENITTQKEAEDTYRKLLQSAQGGDPCEIEWQSGVSCLPGVANVELVITNLRVKAKTSYENPNTSIAKLEFNPTSVKFPNPKIGVLVEKKVTVTARNADFTVTNITSNNAAFSITPTSFVLNAGQSIELTVSYLPTNSGYVFAGFDIESDVCSSKYYASGGFSGVKPKIKTLKLLHPNGGEEFVICSDTVIIWEGIPESDTIQLEYTIDNGVTWKIITDKASGLQYIWKNIPKPSSAQCKVRIKQSINSSGTENAGGLIRTLKGHSGNVSRASWSPDGSRVATASRDSIPRIWDVASGVTLLTLIGHHSYVVDICWSSDGSRIATASRDSTARIWDAASGVTLHKLSGHKDYVWGISWSPDGSRVATVGRDSFVIIWDVTTGDLLYTLSGHTDWVKAVSWSPDGSRVATASNDNSARIWDAASGAMLHTLSGHTNSVLAVSWSPDGSRVATASLDSTARIWDVASGVTLHTLIGHNSYVVDISWSSDGSRVATANNDNSARIWDAASGVTLHKLIGHNQFVWDISWSPDGSRVATASGDNTARIWDAASGATQHTLNGHTDWVIAVSWSPDGSRIATSSYDSTAKIWYVGEGNTVLQEDESDNVFSIVAPSASSIDIDMKQCLIGTTKDSVVVEFIQNTGSWKFRVDSIYFRGADADAFSLVTGFPKYIVDANQVHHAEFRFIPNRVGVHSVEIVIITQSDTLIQNIRGEGVSPRLELVTDLIDFGTVDILNYKDTIQVATIKNIGNAPILITNTKHNFPNAVDFTTLAGGGSFTLQPNDTHKMDLRYKPSSIGRTSGTLEFHYDGVGSPAVIQLYGQGLGGLIKIDNDSAFAGEKRMLRLRLGNNIKPKSNDLTTGFKAVISYNPTLLSCQNVNITKNYSLLAETIEINGKWDGKSNLLGEFEVTAGLGNADSTKLVIEEFNWLDDNEQPIDHEVETQNGTFKLLGICYEGGARLINPNNKVELLQISPNPNDGNLAVELNLIEEGSSTLSIYNSNGQLMYEQSISGSTGKIDLNIDTKEFGNGLYFVSLQTPTIRKVKQMVVFK